MYCLFVYFFCTIQIIHFYINTNSWPENSFRWSIESIFRGSQAVNRCSVVRVGSPRAFNFRIYTPENQVDVLLDPTTQPCCVIQSRMTKSESKISNRKERQLGRQIYNKEKENQMILESFEKLKKEWEILFYKMYKMQKFFKQLEKVVKYNWTAISNLSIFPQRTKSLSHEEIRTQTTAQKQKQNLLMQSPHPRKTRVTT